MPGGFALSRSSVQRLITTGCVSVNRRRASRPAERLALGDVVVVDVVAPPGPRPPAAEQVPLRVVFEDDQILVVAKPPGMVAHPTARQRSGTVVNAVLGHAVQRGDATWTPRLVQRLDRGTSGLMIVARTAAAHTALQRVAGDIVKDYLAVVWGRPLPRRGVIDGALGRDPLDRRRMMVRDDGSRSETTYAVIARSKGEARGLSLVRCRLNTGRTHQIRVHLADRGWPIVGDQTYGHAPRRRLASPLLDRHARAFTRQALHAWRLTLPLPWSGRVLHLEAAVPADFEALLTAAGLDGSVPSSHESVVRSQPGRGGCVPVA